jgi:hypothetical protein
MDNKQQMDQFIYSNKILIKELEKKYSCKFLFYKNKINENLYNYLNFLFSGNFLTKKVLHLII